MWRAFDVGAVVDALHRRGGRIVAGVGGRDRTVERARLVERAGDLGAVEPDELVITTTRALAGALDPAGLLHGLADRGAAAVALRLDPTVAIPPEVLDAADERSFPIISVPPSATWADVTSSVLDALLDAQRQRLDRFLDIHQRFAEVVLAAGDAEAVAATLHALLGHPVAIIDPDGHPSHVVPADAAARIAGEDLSAARVAIRAGEQHYGDVVALTGGQPLDPDGQLALERASMALAVRLAQANAVAADQERFAATTLEELVAGHIRSVVEATERATSFGWDLARPRAVLLASVDPPIDSVALARALATLGAAARATLGPNAIVWTRSTSVAALLAPHSSAAEDRRTSAEALRCELDVRLRTVRVSIGVGTVVADPTGLPRSYREAGRAVEVGRWAKGRHVTEVFDQLGIERLLASASPRDLGDFVEQTIGALVEHDRAHGRDLVETLGVWLEARNMAEAARRMHVHHNTLRNRLDRIEIILGPVLVDPVRCLECEIAIYISRHHDGPWAPAPGG